MHKFVQTVQKDLKIGRIFTIMHKTCPQLFKLFNNVHITCQKLSKYHWKIVHKSSLDSFTSDTMINNEVEYLNDEIKPYILSSLYLQFIDTLGSKYMLMMQVTIQ